MEIKSLPIMMTLKDMEPLIKMEVSSDFMVILARGTWIQQAFNFSLDLHPMLNKDSFETVLKVMIRYFRYR